jgi:uncharacterized membrane protein YfcA
VAAGALAGAAGSAGGIASLVSYPALLAVGLGPLAANVTNAVAGVTLGIGSTLSSREELRDQGRRLRRLAPLCVAGGSAGAVLLLLTPSTVFDWVVPFLVAGASVALLAQRRLTSWHQARPRRRAEPAAVTAVAAVAVYSGYFGAGAGIMILAVLLVFLEHDMARANALKNTLLTVTDAVPAVIFALAGRVVWLAAVPLAVGLFAGGMVGPVVARRAPPGLLRVAIGVCGFGLAAWLLVRAAR